MMMKRLLIVGLAFCGGIAAGAALAWWVMGE
jgi:hypothetical protein